MRNRLNSFGIDSPAGKACVQGAIGRRFIQEVALVETILPAGGCYAATCADDLATALPQQPGDFIKKGRTRQWPAALVPRRTRERDRALRHRERKKEEEGLFAVALP